MKRVVAAFVLFLTAVAFSTWAGYIFISKMDSLENSLNSLVDISDEADSETVAKETEKLVFQWEEFSTLLHAVVLHEGIDELEKKITSLPLLTEYSDRDEIKKICIEAISLIKNLKTCEKVSLENIL